MVGWNDVKLVMSGVRLRVVGKSGGGENTVGHGSGWFASDHVSDEAKWARVTPARRTEAAAIPGRGTGDQFAVPARLENGRNVLIFTHKTGFIYQWVHRPGKYVIELLQGKKSFLCSNPFREPEGLTPKLEAVEIMFSKRVRTKARLLPL